MWLRVDVYISESQVVVEAETPGRSREQLHVRATERTLRIFAEENVPTRDWRDYHRRERGRGGLDREIPLPAAVEPEAAEARLRDGVLQVCLPLRNARPVRRRPGSAGGRGCVEAPILRAVGPPDPGVF